MTPSESWTITFSSALLNWYSQHARSLPWRQTQDPYKIWVSEIMLQQTQTNIQITLEKVKLRLTKGFVTVSHNLKIKIPLVYHKFINRFPTVTHLAQASMEELLSFWSGLGYHRRVRHLKQTAEQIVQDYDGLIPDNKQQLLSLPGIGQYTAGAVLSIAHNLPYPVVDGNVIRIISRVFVILESIGQKKVQDQIWQIAENLIPENRAKDFNQAIMELGALICLGNSKPLCQDCPVKPFCLACQQDLVLDLPVLPEKRTRQKVNQVAFIMVRDKKILLIQRLDERILNEMWETPFGVLLKKESHLKGAVRILRDIYQFETKTKNLRYLGKISHAITFRSITCHVYQLDDPLDLDQKKYDPSSLATPFQWALPTDIDHIPHSSILKKILSLLD